MIAAIKRSDKGRIILVGVLAVSLLGNALSIGAVARFAQMRNAMLGPAGETALFPREVRQDLRDEILTRDGGLTPLLNDLAEARARVVTAGLAAPFDREALEAEMEVFRQEFDRTLEGIQSEVLEVLVRRAAEEGR